MAVQLKTLGWGTVQDQYGNRLTDVAYTITDDDGDTVASSTTDNRGQLSGSLDPGDYTLVIDGETYPVRVPGSAGAEISIRDYTGLDDTGTSDMATLFNQISQDASDLADDNDYPYVTVGGFGRGIYRIDDNLQIRDRVRFNLDQATILVGADLVDSGVFRATETQTAAAAIGNGTTTNGSKLVSSVVGITSWQEGDPVTGTHIAANTKIAQVDITGTRLVLTKAAIGTGTATLTKGATYYGSYRSAGLIGGKIDPNGKAVGAGVRALWTENLLIKDTEVVHNRKTGDDNWAFQVGGRDLCAVRPRVTGGTKVFQDGFHVMHGQRIRVDSPDIQGAGDDSVVVGGEMTASLEAQAEGVEDVTITGVVAKSTRSSALAVYAPEPSATALSNGWVAADYGVNRVTCHGLVGKTGRLRNGGIKILDVSNPLTASYPALINGVHIDGVDLEIGSVAHDGVNPRGIWVQGANNVTITGRVSVAGEKVGASSSETFRLAYLRGSSDVTLTLSSEEMGSSYGVDASGCPNLTLDGGTLRYGTGSEHPIRLLDCEDFKVLDMRLLDIPDGEQGISIETSGSQTCSGRIAGNTFAQEAGATTGQGLYVVADSFTSLAVESNNFLDCVAGVNDITNITDGPAFVVRNNLGLTDVGAGVENGQAGLVAPTLTYGSETSTLLTASQAYFMRAVPSVSHDITKIAFVVTSAAGGDDSFSVGITDSTGTTLLATSGPCTGGSANVSGGGLNSTGIKTITLSGTASLAAGATYYAVFTRGTVSTGSAGQLAFCTIGAANVGAMFGGALGKAEIGLEASAHPVAVPLSLTGASTGPLLALRDS